MVETKICEFCGKEFEKTKTTSLKTWETRKYCSLKCINSVKKPKTKCLYCGKEKEVHPCKFKKSENHFCDRKCYDKYRDEIGNVFLICNQCGVKFKRRKSKLNTLTDWNFCSDICTHKFMKTDEWKEFTREKSTNRIQTKETRQKLSEMRTGENNPFYRHKHTEKQKKKWSENRTGENGTNWKGGITPLNLAIRGSFKNRQWIQNVFKRDKYICQHCGKTTGGDLNAHHIVFLSTLLSENKIESLEDAFNCDKFWDVNNGLTLCKKCHQKVHGKSND